jgi:hypothetical protein
VIQFNVHQKHLTVSLGSGLSNIHSLLTLFHAKKIGNIYLSLPGESGTLPFKYTHPNVWISCYFLPAQKDNYAPMWLMVSVSKTENKLEVVQWYD